MTYTINKTDGNELTKIPDGTLDTTATALTLIGRNSVGFGEAFNENFVKLLENFASTTAPENAIKGQIWFDTRTNRLNVFDGNIFRASGGPQVSPRVPDPLTTGDLWINNETNQMYMYDGTDLILVGPIYTAQQGITGFKVDTVLDIDGVSHSICQLFVKSALLGIFSSTAFFPKLPIPGYGTVDKPIKVGFNDSQWRQMEIQKELYHWLNERGVYINAPDWYFLDGTHKIAIGYREVNFSLPREQQRILNRQNIHDGTIEKTGSMSWGFVPLTNYQGTDPRAVLEPLSEHLADYEQLMIQYYGAGVQACYRGPRLYDTETTRQMVARTINWYKKYRSILNADMIQLRRADGRDWDGLIHVDPSSKQKALGMLYNPTKEKITRTIPVPLYYTGLTTTATLALKDDKSTAKKYTLTRNHELMLTVTIEPESYTWFTVE